MISPLGHNGDMFQVFGALALSIRCAFEWHFIASVASLITSLHCLIPSVAHVSSVGCSPLEQISVTWRPGVSSDQEQRCSFAVAAATSGKDQGYRVASKRC